MTDPHEANSIVMDGEVSNRKSFLSVSCSHSM